MFRQYRGLKKELYILFIGYLVTAMGSFVAPMLTFFLTSKLGIANGTATLLIAISAVVSFPFALLGGKLADRFDRKKLIIIFDLITVSFYFLSAALPIGYHTAALIFAASLFQTMEHPSYDALNADFSTAADRTGAVSMSYLGYNLGYIAGAAVAGVLFENHTRLSFFINGAAILTSTVLITLFVDMKNAVGNTDDETECYSEYEIPTDEKLSIFSALKGRRSVISVLIIGCIAAMPSTALAVILPLQLKDTLGASGAAIYGYLNSLNGFTVILFTPIFTALLKRITEIPKSVIGALLFGAGMFFFRDNAPILLFFVGMFVFSLGEVTDVLGMRPYASKRTPASHRGRIGGFNTVTRSVFTSVTQFSVSAMLFTFGNDYRLMWLIFSGVSTVAALLYILTYKPDRRTFPKLYLSASKSREMSGNK